MSSESKEKINYRGSAMSGMGFGVFWVVWDLYGFWWGVLYGIFWPVWLGARLATYLLS